MYETERREKVLHTEIQEIKKKTIEKEIMRITIW